MTEIIIQGRPDLGNHSFGRTHAKRFPPYVYSTDANGCLVHQVKSVEFGWYDVETRDSLRRLQNPRVVIMTKCNQMFFPKNRHRGTAAVCELPNADALRCGRCEGRAATFRKNGDYAERKKAHEKLGCLVEVQP